MTTRISSSSRTRSSIRRTRQSANENDAIHFAVKALAVHLRLTALTSDCDVFEGDFEVRIESARAILVAVEQITPTIAEARATLDLNAPGHLYEAPRRVRRLIGHLTRDAHALARRYRR